MSLASCQPVQLVAADGSPMVCSQQIRNLQWIVQGHSFISTVGVLPLKNFDMILGQDWLESCSPMWVHWSKKILRFTHHGQRITLHGLGQDLNRWASVSSAGLVGLCNHQNITCCVQVKLIPEMEVGFSPEQVVQSLSVPGDSTVPVEIQKLLDTYTALFQEPKALPPPRQFDHQI